MNNYPIRSKMEEGRRRRRGRGATALDRLQQISSTCTKLSSVLGLALLFSCQWTVAQEDVGLSSDNSTAALRISGKTGLHSTNCTHFTINGDDTIVCSGFPAIPTDFREFTQILPDLTMKVLDMSTGNSLQTLKSGMFSQVEYDVSALKTLKFANCSIRTIEKGAFSGVGRLMTLDLSNNRIETLDPEVFAGLDYLVTLILKNNRINRFQNAFPPLPQLVNIDLSFCKLRSIPEGIFDQLKLLQKLELKNNEMQRLSWKAISNITHGLNTLDLSGNQWVCDCHVKFLIDELETRQLSNTMKAVCSNGTSESVIGQSWLSVPRETLICPAEIRRLDLKHYDSNTHTRPSDQGQISTLEHPQGEEDDGVKLGHEVHFECEYTGFPAPSITWLKDGKPIQESHGGVESVPRAAQEGRQGGSSENDHEMASDRPPTTPLRKIEFQAGNIHSEGMTNEEKQKTYEFQETLIIRKVEAEDRGTYECLVEGVNGWRVQKTKILNFTVPWDDGLFLGGIGGKKGLAIWMWILIALLCILILVLLTLIVCLVWRRREKRKQEGFKKVIQEKFKDSHVDVGELLEIKSSNNQQQQHQSRDNSPPDGTTPLLDNRSDSSTVLISDHFPPHKASLLPDVALGNGELLRNSGIFSPKPPPAINGHITPADARREFFARQISEPYLRPVSAMSITRPSHMNAAQKRYIFANAQMQSEPLPGVHGEPQYAIPDQYRTLPRSGSAMSMSALPDHDLRRQMFLRQAPPQSYYGTGVRVPRRNPSVSSEPPHELAAFTYSTLPRRPNRYQTWSRPVSPTNSTCSNYSTLSWRPNVHPVTGVVSDGVGPRRGADGGSTLSLNKIPDSINGSNSNLNVAVGNNNNGIDSMNRAMMMTPVQAQMQMQNGGGKIKSLPRNQRLHTRTPNSLTRGHNDFFSFEPIQEVEGSESASTNNLDKTGGRQTPQGLYTQSLARGEPRYKKKKPPPLAHIPTNLKAPSGAFDHLKGRSASPAPKAILEPEPDPNVLNDVPLKSEPVIVEDLSIRKSRLLLKNGVAIPVNGVSNDNNMAPVLESPIDEVIQPQEVQPAKPKLPPPLPPPKPKRSQEALDRGSQDNLDNREEGIYQEIAGDSGTVV